MSYQPSFYERATITRNPFYAAFVPFPFVCFILAFATDVAYALTSNLMWQNFSSWLLFVGLVMGALAAVAGAVDLIRRKELRGLPVAWAHGIVGLITLGLALLNSLVHARDGWTGVIWEGLVLSLATVVFVIAAAALGRIMMYE